MTNATATTKAAKVTKASPEFMQNMAKAGRLATGLNSRNAPQSALAAAESQRKFKEATTGDKPAKPSKPAAKKDAKPATKPAAKPTTAKERGKAAVAAAKGRTEAKKEVRKALTAGSNRAYKVLVPVSKLEARPDSWRYAMLAAICGNKDTDSAKAAIAKNRAFKDRKLDFSWAAAQKYIQF